jgi:hypothetical protein
MMRPEAGKCLKAGWPSHYTVTNTEKPRRTGFPAFAGNEDGERQNAGNATLTPQITSSARTSLAATFTSGLTA